jgi:hypothetical protein
MGRFPFLSRKPISYYQDNGSNFFSVEKIYAGLFLPGLRVSPRLRGVFFAANYYFAT